MNQLSKNLPTYLLIFGLFLLLFSCSKKENALETVEDSEEIKTTEDSFIVTQEQFANGKMKLGTFEERSFSDIVQTNGYIDVPPESKVKINAFFGGHIDKIGLLVGNDVKKGQVLASIINPEFIEFQEEYLKTKEQLAYLKPEFERQKVLSEENITSQKNFLKAKGEYNVALAKFSGLKEKLKLLNIDMVEVEKGNFSSSAIIKAPISGSITKLFVSAGSYVSPADELMEIIKMDHIHLELQIFEKDAIKVKEGQEILFRIPNYSTEEYEGEVHLVAKSIDEDKRMIKVHGHLMDESLPLIVGMYIEARILTDTVTSISLSKETILDNADKSYILTTLNEGKTEMVFKLKEVKMGRNSKDFIEILEYEPLSPGEEILLKGGFQLVQFD